MGNVTKGTLGGFKWVENTSEFNKDIENYNEEIDIEYFLEIDVQYPKNFLELPNDLRFSPEIMKIGKVKKLVTNLYDKRCCTCVEFKIIHWFEYRAEKNWKNDFQKDFSS